MLLHGQRPDDLILNEFLKRSSAVRRRYCRSLLQQTPTCLFHCFKQDIHTKYMFHASLKVPYFSEFSLLMFSYNNTSGKTPMQPWSTFQKLGCDVTKSTNPFLHATRCPLLSAMKNEDLKTAVMLLLLFKCAMRSRRNEEVHLYCGTVIHLKPHSIKSNDALLSEN